MNDIRLSLLVLKTRQMDALRRFYGSLGIELTEEQHGKGPVHFAGNFAGVVFEVYPLNDVDSSDSTTRLGFVLGNLEAVVEVLKAREIPFITDLKPTQWGLRAVVRDPDGRAVELYQK